jgi:uncharacterized protein YbaA (DUF1428 family)
MPAYVDGYVIPLPTRNLPAYRRIARVAAKVWLEHGALDYQECAGDDLAVAFGATFPRPLKVKRNETVVFAWVRFRSRAHRDRINRKVMADPRLLALCDPKSTPFDPARMLYGGFRVIVDGPAATARVRRRRAAAA